MGRYWNKNESWFNKKAKQNDPNSSEYLNVPYDTSKVPGLYNSQEALENQKALQNGASNSNWNGTTYVNYGTVTSGTYPTTIAVGGSGSILGTTFNGTAWVNAMYYPPGVEARAKPIIAYMTKVLSCK